MLLWLVLRTQHTSRFRSISQLESFRSRNRSFKRLPDNTNMNAYASKLKFEQSQVKEFYAALSLLDVTRLDPQTLVDYKNTCNSLRLVRAILESLPESPTLEQERVAVSQIDKIWSAPPVNA